MARAQSVLPPLSPVLLAGFTLRTLPLSLLQKPFDTAMATVHRRHPEVFERLAQLDDPIYLIDPVDLPIVFLLRPDPLMPTLTVMRDAPEETATANIRGPLLKLIELMEGKVDGDALFFSRDLVIEGDTEHVVALRNAVDGADVDVLTDLLSALGPLADPARKATESLGKLFSVASQDLETLRQAMIAPAIRKTDAQAATLRKLDEKVEKATKRRSPGRKIPKIPKVETS
ncbi:MAG: ubiquinone anaerobic biosynthesis accessory factor UbiT [Magnetospiraceae bacterium]